jgi:hypothetical protein
MLSPDLPPVHAERHLAPLVWQAGGLRTILGYGADL